MTTRIIIRSTDDPPRVIKYFSDHTEARHEARWLAQAAQPGVVRLVEVRLHPPDVRIETELVAGSTLRSAQLTPDSAAAVLGSLARTMARLHNDGLVHGNLDPDHVLIPGRASPRGAMTDQPLVGAIVCSPKGASPLDPDHRAGRFATEELGLRSDWAGFHSCLTWLIGTWRAGGVKIPARWLELEAWMDDALSCPQRSPRQQDGHPCQRHSHPGSFRRLERRLSELGGVPRLTMGSARGLLLAGLGGSVALGGLVLTSRTSTPRSLDESATPITVLTLETGRYDLLADSDGEYVTLVVEQACAHQPVVVTLDRSNNTIWGFSDNEFDAEALATIDGATGLAVEPPATPAGCPMVYVIGPHGEQLRLEP